MDSDLFVLEVYHLAQVLVKLLDVKEAIHYLMENVSNVTKVVNNVHMTHHLLPQHVQPVLRDISYYLVEYVQDVQIQTVKNAEDPHSVQLAKKAMLQ